MHTCEGYNLFGEICLQRDRIQCDVPFFSLEYYKIMSGSRRWCLPYVGYPEWGSMRNRVAFLLIESINLARP